MSKKKEKGEEKVTVRNTVPLPSAQEAGAPPRRVESTTEAVPTLEETLRNQLDESETRFKELEDRYLRLAAEFDNFRKRTNRDLATIIKNANENLILQQIDIVDNFHRALDAAKTSADFDSFHKGVELIYTQMFDILNREGVQIIEPAGQVFDPHFHEAIMYVESDQPEGKVIEVVSTGYLLNDKVLRPARVVVSKGKTRASPENREEEKS